MSDNILSQAEIDALMDGSSDSPAVEPHVPSSPENSKDGEEEVRPYDPTTQRQVVRERLQALEIINERFARHFRVGLFNLLRRSVDITVAPTKIQPYHNFARNLPIPCNLNLLYFKPLRGIALMIFSPNLVFMAVDNLFGGDGRFPIKVDGREFTPTEQRVIQRILRLALESYHEAWKAIFKLELEYIRSESQIKFTNITSSPNDIVISTDFNVEVSSLSGEFSICIPFSMIEPLRELLLNPPLENSQQENQHWRNTLSQQVQYSEIELVAHFVDVPLHLSKLLELQLGDVLPIEKPENIIASVDGIPVLICQYGRQHSQYALRVEQLINPSLDLNSRENSDE